MPSNKPVYVKLGLKPVHRAFQFHLPGNGAASLGEIPAGCRFEKSFSGEFDFLLGFYETAKDLKSDAPRIKKGLRKAGMAWVCWKKGNVTDLSRDSIAALADTTGLEAVSSCSIDDEWSALKLMYPRAQRQ